MKVQNILLIGLLAAHTYHVIKLDAEVAALKKKPANNHSVVHSGKPKEPPLVQRARFYAEKHGIQPELFFALIEQESRWNTDAVSPVGAAGLTQLMPATALSECGLESEERFDAEKNMNCGAAYFSDQLKRFGSVDLALAAYNSGPHRIAKLWRIPRIKETQNYVRNITENFERMLSENPNGESQI
jgi:soluble lytic murein transglycosylase-like protein